MLIRSFNAHQPRIGDTIQAAKRGNSETYAGIYLGKEGTRYHRISTYDHQGPSGDARPITAYFIGRDSWIAPKFISIDVRQPNEGQVIMTPSMNNCFYKYVEPLHLAVNEHLDIRIVEQWLPYYDQAETD